MISAITNSTKVYIILPNSQLVYTFLKIVGPSITIASVKILVHEKLVRKNSVR